MLAAVTFYASGAMKGTPGTGAAERGLIAAAKTNQCVATVSAVVDNLLLTGRCTESQISYELPDGVNANPSAPGDGSCHAFRAAGGGATPCGPYLDCDLPLLTPGQKCTYADIIYVGISGGNRIYTTAANIASAPFNNGTNNWTVTGVTSTSDGLANTNTLVALVDAGTPYRAAVNCRQLGPDWYLPAKDELEFLYNNRTLGALNGTLPTGNEYVSSTEASNANVWLLDFATGVFDGSSTNKYDSSRLRCVRR